jgi:hypothetical protein
VIAVSRSLPTVRTRMTPPKSPAATERLGCIGEAAITCRAAKPQIALTLISVGRSIFSSFGAWCPDECSIRMQRESSSQETIFRASQITMIDLNEMVEINDFSNDTLIALADRLEQSNSFQELLVREAELDEIYRRVETALIDASSENDQHSRAGLQQLFQRVWEAHDLAAEGEPKEAARRLRQAMTGDTGL